VSQIRGGASARSQLKPAFAPPLPGFDLTVSLSIVVIFPVETGLRKRMDIERSIRYGWSIKKLDFAWILPAEPCGSLRELLQLCPQPPYLILEILTVDRIGDALELDFQSRDQHSQNDASIVRRQAGMRECHDSLARDKLAGVPVNRR
jgi:hypothetical protein